MAALTNEQKRKLRNAMERKAAEMGVPVRWIKACLEDTGQAVIDALVAIKPQVAADMNAASQPYGITFNAAEKKKIAALAMQIMFEGDFEGIS